MPVQAGVRDHASVPTTIVVPLDGTALCEMPLPLAYLLASQFRATVRTVTVGVDGRDVAAEVILPRRCSTISPSASARWCACPGTGMVASGVD